MIALGKEFELEIKPMEAIAGALAETVKTKSNHTESGHAESRHVQLSMVDVSAVSGAINIGPVLAKIRAWCICGAIVAAIAASHYLR